MYNLIVDADFSFGHRREGDVTLLQQMGETFGFETMAVDEVRGDGERISMIKLKKFCSDRLPVYMVPDQFRFHAELPKTSTGKIQKFRLREQEWAGRDRRIH